ncbi:MULTISPECIES: hypothetical protein [Calothrix]|uniref:Uncharacterized protein n=2 Tax=Calothrix TaxID=1186 RepID=A0ABR8AED7_9CYAN|nr:MULTISPECIES: hypothetical protein [Calothrix]MBD2198392.1 hypothetical protein [Calothrix parietina FACHB-288]MBD2226717.1 hypothetical protein [Calothrix anomala FACHB-343]
MNRILFSGAISLIRSELGITDLKEKVDYNKESANLFKISRSQENLFNEDLQYLLFGQIDEKIIPYSWIQASWNYIDKFRCSFGFNLAEVLLYPMITIVGTPDIPVPVTKEQENTIKKSLESLPEFTIERLWIKSPEELAVLLDNRVIQNERFEGGDVGPHAPV